MLHFITSAPQAVVRGVMSIADGFCEPAPESAPIWADTVVHVADHDAANVIHALRDWRIEGRKPARQAISDPTFALAAAAIDRGDGGSSAPATIYTFG